MTDYDSPKRENMRSLFKNLKRLVSPVPPGYDHPALKDMFNKLAQSPFGRQAVAYCKRRDYEIIVTDKMAEKNILGTCSYTDIQLRPDATSGTMAHEMRHAFQMHGLETHAGGLFNPVFKHMEVRMTEADAFTYTCLVKMSRWKELGYEPQDIYLEKDELNDTDSIEIKAYAAYARKEFDPAVLLEILRRVFNYHYEIITVSSSSIREGYERRGMEAAERAYQRLEDALMPPQTMMEVVMNALFGRDRQAGLKTMVAEYNNTAALIDDLAERLGQVPGLKGNYLTDTTGPKLSSSYYVGLAMPDVLQFHAERHRKIETQMNRHKLLVPPDKSPRPLNP